MNQYRFLSVVIGALAFIAPSVNAQDPAPSVQDLVGARGSSGEMELERRGYQFVKTEKSSDSAYS